MKKVLYVQPSELENIIVVKDLGKFNFVENNIIDKFDFCKLDKVVDIGYRKLKVQARVIIPVEILNAVVFDTTGQEQYVPLIFTPHYRYIRSKIKNKHDQKIKDEYVSYMKNVYNLNEKKSISKVDRLLNHYYKFKNFNEIVVLPPQKSISNGQIFFSIYDGIHRASILKSSGIKNIGANILVIAQPVCENE
jgi:hypothetical protein